MGSVFRSPTACTGPLLLGRRTNSSSLIDSIKQRQLEPTPQASFRSTPPPLPRQLSFLQSNDSLPPLLKNTILQNHRNTWLPRLTGSRQLFSPNPSPISSSTPEPKRKLKNWALELDSDFLEALVFKGRKFWGKVWRVTLFIKSFLLTIDLQKPLPRTLRSFEMRRLKGRIQYVDYGSRLKARVITPYLYNNRYLIRDSSGKGKLISIQIPVG